MSHINRPQWPATSTRAVDAEPTTERPEQTTASTLLVWPRAAGPSQGLMRDSADAHPGVPSTSLSTHSRQQVNMYVSLTEYLLAPPGTFTNGASPARHHAGAVAFSPQQVATETPYHSPLLAVPPDVQALQTNAALSPLTHQGYVPSQIDAWVESMFGIAGFGAQAAPQLLSTSHLMSTAAGAAPGMQTYHGPAPGDASAGDEQWLNHLFAPHALENNALSRVDVPASLITQAYDETPVAQSDSRLDGLSDISKDQQDLPSTSTVASGSQQVADLHLMDVDSAMRDAFSLEQTYHLFAENLSEIPTMPTTSALGAVEAQNETRERSLVGGPAALDAANEAGGKATTAKRRRKLVNQAGPQAEERAAAGAKEPAGRSGARGLSHVDPHTGKFVPRGTPGAIIRVFYNYRQVVDPQTGQPVAAGTPGAIAKKTYYNRQAVDPQTGQPVAAGTPGAMARKTYFNRKATDPQTGKRVAAGTPGAITANAFYGRKLVDPETGAVVAAGTSGAITRGAYWYKLLRLVDPETGEHVPQSTPGAITLRAFLVRKQKPDV